MLTALAVLQGCAGSAAEGGSGGTSAGPGESAGAGDSAMDSKGDSQADESSANDDGASQGDDTGSKEDTGSEEQSDDASDSSSDDEQSGDEATDEAGDDTGSTGGDESTDSESTDTGDDGEAEESGDDGGHCDNDGKDPPPFDWTDNHPPSQDPPCGITPKRVPMFVTMGWDDNGYSGLEGSNGDGGMIWSLDFMRDLKNPAGTGKKGTFDGSPVRSSYYFTSTYVGMWMAESPTLVKKSWRGALDDGHEIGNHTHRHADGKNFDVSTWRDELSTCNEWLVKPYDPDEVTHTPDDSKGIGVLPEEIFGFRTPFLQYNDATLAAVRELQFWYDCSIEDGWQRDHDGTNYLWPYTLDEGSPGHEVLVEMGTKEPIDPRPGLWEMPVHPLIVPPDEECENYDVPVGLRDKLHALNDWFNVDTGKITGFDYNLWVAFEFNKAEFLATLKYTFDLRMKGNRAPLMLGTHTDEYSDKYTHPPNATYRERQEAIEEFIEYALSHEDTRFVTYKDILDWMRHPVALD